MALARDRSRAPARSLTEFALTRLDGLCDAIDASPPERADARAIVELITGGWGELPAEGAPPWPNDLTDDGTPLEFSLGFEKDKPDLRLLFESQPRDGVLSQQSSWHAGLALQAQLRSRHLSDCSQFERIASLFAPAANHCPRFSLWHALVLGEPGATLFKAYVNPEVGGVQGSRALAKEALHQLGLARAWQFVDARLSRTTRLPYLSVDLKPAQASRVKLYLSATDAEDAERLTHGTINLRSGDARRWLEALTKGQGPYSDRPILICYAFRGDGASPEATVHVPVRSYAPNDEEALRRTIGLMSAAHAAQLERAMKELMRAPLHVSRGMLSYVSLRVVDGHVRVTAYLAPGAYTPAEDARDSRPPPGPSRLGRPQE